MNYFHSKKPNLFITLFAWNVRMKFSKMKLIIQTILENG